MGSFRKIISGILVLALVAALAVPAVAEAPEIFLDQQVEVSVADNETPMLFRFTPQQSGYYCYYSSNQGDSDPYGYITDDYGDVLIYGDDMEDENTNFRISMYLNAGVTYFLGATSYAYGAQYTIQVQKQASPTGLSFVDQSISGPMGSIYHPELVFEPAGCAEEPVTLTSSDSGRVYVNEYGTLYFISPGTATITAQTSSGLKATITATTMDPPDIELDQPYLLDAAQGNQFLTFTAKAAGWYGVVSEGDEIDAYVCVYDRNFSLIADDDDSLGDYNFFASFYLNAGESRYLELQPYDHTGYSTVTVQKLDRPVSIDLEEDEITAYLGGFCSLAPVNMPVVSSPETLSWTSSNPSVAKVDRYGYVDFLAKGTAVIRFTSETGKTDSVKITVIGSPTDNDLVAWGICGPQLQWKLNTAGVLTISGYGEMYDYYYTWQDHASQIRKVIFPSGITSISENAFNGCGNLSEVTIPQGVKSIGYGAFMDCAGLKKVSLPDSITSIGYAAFRRCAALTEVKLPSGLTSLGQYVFAECESLTTVTGGSYSRLPMRTFSQCHALTQVELPEELASIGDFAFYACPLTGIVLPENLLSIGYAAFEGCGLTDIALPESLTTIHHCAFLSCPLTQITIPERVSYLGDNLFQDSQLSNVTFIGRAPYFSPDTFGGLRLTANYPAGDITWTQGARQNYGGQVTWVGYGAAGGVLTGTIQSADGAQVTLDLWSPGSTSPDHSFLADEGAYRFSGIGFGVYVLSVSAPHHVPRDYTVTVGEDTTMDVQICRFGDVNQDQKTNLGDAARVFAHVRSKNPITDDYALLCADVNNDSKINIGDVARIHSHARGKSLLW